MSIIVDEGTKLVVSGLTGREGTFHGLRNRDYGTDLVAGVTPGKGGQDVEGVPVFDSIREAVDQRGANTSMIFVPARFAAAAIEEAIDAGVETVSTSRSSSQAPFAFAASISARPAAVIRPAASSSSTRSRLRWVQRLLGRRGVIVIDVRTSSTPLAWLSTQPKQSASSTISS